MTALDHGCSHSALVAGTPLVSRPASAVDPLTLDDAVSRALETSHRLGEARARRGGRAGGGRRSGARPISRRVAVSGGYTRTNHVDAFGVPQPTARLRVIYPDIPDNYFTRVACSGRSTPPGASMRSSARRPPRRAPSARSVDSGPRRSAARGRARVLGARHRDRSRAGAARRRSTRADAHLRDVRSRVRRRPGSAQRRLERRGAALAAADAADRGAATSGAASPKTCGG